MSLVNLSLKRFFQAERLHPEDGCFDRISQYLTRRLNAASEALGESGLYFEADEAQALALSFDKIRTDSLGAEDFATAWNALEDWAGSQAYLNGREYTLCTLPHLPDRFTC